MTRRFASATAPAPSGGPAPALPPAPYRLPPARIRGCGRGRRGARRGRREWRPSRPAGGSSPRPCGARYGDDLRRDEAGARLGQADLRVLRDDHDIGAAGHAEAAAGAGALDHRDDGLRQRVQQLQHMAHPAIDGEERVRVRRRRDVAQHRHVAAGRELPALAAQHDRAGIRLLRIPERGQAARPSSPGSARCGARALSAGREGRSPRRSTRTGLTTGTRTRPRRGSRRGAPRPRAR